jgi:two-component system chemotaxis response regulator CheY
MTDKKPRTAMIVDDAFFMRNLLRSILEMGGYTVVAEAEDGDAAMATYRACRPDLVLMDIIMPVKNGIDATREIVALDPKARVVMCSILGQELLTLSALDAGARGVIMKPFTAEDVLITLENVLAGKSITKEGILRSAEKLRILDV